MQKIVCLVKRLVKGECNYIQSPRLRFGYFTKTLRVMQLTAFFLLSLSMTVCAEGTSQSISLSSKNISLKEVFTAVKKQTGFVVFGNESLLKDTKPVSVNVIAMPLADFLSLVLIDQPLDYKIIDKTVFLYRKSVVVSSDRQLQLDGTAAMGLRKKSRSES